MPVGGPQWLLLEETGGVEEAAEELRINILARLAAEPATLHRLLDDLRRLVDAGIQPPGYTLGEVVLELRLYREAGIVYEEPATAKLHVELSLLAPDARSMVYSRAAVIAEALGLEKHAVAPNAVGQPASVHA